jgi:hypothetical protein
MEGAKGNCGLGGTKSKKISGALPGIEPGPLAP